MTSFQSSQHRLFNSSTSLRNSPISRTSPSFPSDTVVFGSDGLFDYTELETILSDATVSTSSAADVAAAMARDSVTRDNSRDNVAVVVLRTGKAAAGEEGRTEL